MNSGKSIQITDTNNIEIIKKNRFWSIQIKIKIENICSLVEQIQDKVVRENFILLSGGYLKSTRSYDTQFKEQIIIKIPDCGKREKGPENVFKETIPENFPNLGAKMGIQVHKDNLPLISIYIHIYEGTL